MAMSSVCRVPVFAAAMALLLVVAVPPAAVGGAPAGPAPVNVLQDCWTTNLEANPDSELELYSYTSTDPITFVWKHKLLQSCPSYNAKIWVYECRDGKPRANIKPAVKFNRIPYGEILADPENPEPLISFTAAPGSIPTGRWDWILLTESADTNGSVWLDGDIDDECGINVGTFTGKFGGALILGPEPVEALDPDPGGAPPGRGPGEEGTTRPWCFEVTESGACEPQMCGTYTNCNPDPTGGFCGCVAVAEGGGVCSSGGTCGTPCPNGTSDCSAGQVCVLNSCCAGPVCLSSTCSGTAASSALSGPTAFGSSR